MRVLSSCLMNLTTRAPSQTPYKSDHSIPVLCKLEILNCKSFIYLIIEPNLGERICKHCQYLFIRTFTKHYSLHNREDERLWACIRSQLFITDDRWETSRSPFSLHHSLQTLFQHSVKTFYHLAIIIMEVNALLMQALCKSGDLPSFVLRDFTLLLTWD